jgi:glycosyltransferase involved in cell wall biosynthesis
MNSKLFPKISIVTPSFNQGQFLEETILSVLGQNYPNLEYVIIDGGSKDGSLEIIRKYAGRLHFWTSEPDKGMYDGINKGFAKSTGEIMAWINSDDKYTPWCFQVISDIFTQLPEVEWLTSRYPLIWEDSGGPSGCIMVEGYNKQAFRRGRNLLKKHDRFFTYGIQQESTFWRRNLWQRAGRQLDSALKFAGDFDLWARFWQSGAILYSVNVPLGGFRKQPEQKTATFLDQYLMESEIVLKKYGGSRLDPIQALFRYGLRGIFSRWLLRHSCLAFKAKIIYFNEKKHSWDILDEGFV